MFSANEVERLFIKNILKVKLRVLVMFWSCRFVRYLEAVVLMQLADPPNGLNKYCSMSFDATFVELFFIFFLVRLYRMCKLLRSLLAIYFRILGTLGDCITHNKVSLAFILFKNFAS